MALRRLQALAALAVMAGCNRGGHTGPLGPESRLQLLNFTLAEGETTKQEILEQWGVPFSTYEDDRIWTYAMVQGREGTLTPRQPRKPSPKPGFETWEDGTYHLILIFSADLLKSCHLLRIS